VQVGSRTSVVEIETVDVYADPHRRAILPPVDSVLPSGPGDGGVG
jgi:hypothetical protein